MAPHRKDDKQPLDAVSMAPTAIRIGRAQRRRFDRLQSKVAAERGRPTTSGELFDHLLRLGESASESREAEEWRPLNAHELEQVMALPLDFGFEIGDVDQVLYGRRPRPRR